MVSWVISSVELAGQVEAEKQRVRESTAGDLPEGRGRRIREGKREHVRADALLDRERVLRIPRREPADAWRNFANDVAVGRIRRRAPMPTKPVSRVVPLRDNVLCAQHGAAYTATTFPSVRETTRPSAGM